MRDVRKCVRIDFPQAAPRKCADRLDEISDLKIYILCLVS
jgi:hypothetical protein